jgi:hypothetical protein
VPRVDGATDRGSVKDSTAVKQTNVFPPDQYTPHFGRGAGEQYELQLRVAT